ncbi:alpha/beta hydrolase [Leifsonia sp. NPDC056665]|uniref:alpha/beta hydrolase n=1 Tax=Leifsonia sp. NPDC056665 TaxID=3345901 RepID=UPI003691AB81
MRDLAESDPIRVAGAAVAFRDTAAQMVGFAREAESAQTAFAESFRSRRMPDVVARYVKPGREALENAHTTAQELCRAVEAAWQAHGELARRRDTLLVSVDEMYARDIPTVIEAWMMVHGATHYPEIHEVPAAVELEEDARWQVSAFNRAAEEFVEEFERAIRAVRVAARDRVARPSAAGVSAPMVPAKRLRSMTPAQVEEWWSSLTSAARQKYVTELPGVIGTLDGVDAASRSAANRAELARFAAELKTIATDDPGYAAAQVKLRAVEAIQETLGPHPEHRKPPRQLLLLDLTGANPKAAVSVGDLDTADHVTYSIPGMMTTVAKDMSAWTSASQNLHFKQQQIARERGASERIAVVAWLGYDAPQNAAQVSASDSARAGGKSLAASLEGTLASRGWPAKSERLSVVGFSYGSTVAAEALKLASAGTFASVGSAGIRLESAPSTGVPRDRTDLIPRPTPLNVPRGGISAGQSSGDAVATVGRLASGRADPADFGAVPFSTDNARTPEGMDTAGTTEHEATVHASNPDAYGYYDAETSALHNLAAHTMGYPNAVAK